MTTYLLIQTEGGRVGEAAAALRTVASPGAVEVVQGPFDIIARAESEGWESELLSRCVGPPFIRVLPCRSASARSTRHR